MYLFNRAAAVGSITVTVTSTGPYNPYTIGTIGSASILSFSASILPSILPPILQGGRVEGWKDGRMVGRMVGWQGGWWEGKGGRDSLLGRALILQATQQRPKGRRTLASTKPGCREIREDNHPWLRTPTRVEQYWGGGIYLVTQDD